MIYNEHGTLYYLLCYYRSWYVCSFTHDSDSRAGIYSLQGLKDEMIIIGFWPLGT